MDDMMEIRQLDHVNLRTTQLEVMIAWYRDILGLRLGARPDFPFPGAWMYAGDQAFVHLLGIEGTPGAGSETALKMEHVAFSANGAAAFETRLLAHDQKFRKSEIAEIGIVAFNVWDPDGNHIHVDFSTEE